MIKVVVNPDINVSYFSKVILLKKENRLKFIINVIMCATKNVARFLLNQPYRPNERNHKVKFAVGNGMAPSIWERVQG